MDSGYLSFGRRLPDLENEIKIPDYFLNDIADIEERSRYEIDEGWYLIILRIPYAKEIPSRTPFTTIPLGIIIKNSLIITVCNFETDMMNDFLIHQQRRGVGIADPPEMVFRLFLSSAVWYLKRLKQISTLIEQYKRSLDHNIDNVDLINFSRLQDSLTYFVTSIRGNETLLSKLKFRLPIDELDADLIEDVNIEMNQARETTSIYSNILDSTMDTYANIINNNMSQVMRTLTGISLILMVPTLITSAFGMNLVNSMENDWWGFGLVVIVSIIITVAFYWFFRSRKFL